MTEACGLVLDDQAKWQLMMEMERYHSKLRLLESLHHEATDDLARHACMEHLERITDIYARAGARNGDRMQPLPWTHDPIALQ